MRRRIKVITLGCSKNTVDTEHLLAQLPADAFDIVDGNGPVDCLLLNTCGFIGDAKEESVNAILEAVEAKKRGEAGGLVPATFRPSCATWACSPVRRSPAA